MRAVWDIAPQVDTNLPRLRSAMRNPCPALIHHLHGHRRRSPDELRAPLQSTILVAERREWVTPVQVMGIIRNRRPSLRRLVVVLREALPRIEATSHLAAIPLLRRWVVAAILQARVREHQIPAVGHLPQTSQTLTDLLPLPLLTNSATTDPRRIVCTLEGQALHLRNSPRDTITFNIF